jgi:Rrf2 family nitric oxide-sensitive transcriptional repressor
LTFITFLTAQTLIFAVTEKLNMQLSKFTDYAFRVLIILSENPTATTLQTAEELASRLQTSEHHLKKVIQELARKGFILSQKGRTGGLRLAKAPSEINLCDVLLEMEENMNIVGCFADVSVCPLAAAGCKLQSLISNATQIFLQQFADKTLADII